MSDDFNAPALPALPLSPVKYRRQFLLPVVRNLSVDTSPIDTETSGLGQLTKPCCDHSDSESQNCHCDPNENASVTSAPYFRVKSILDRVLTLVLMTLALPLMAFVGLAILVLDGRPVFYRQTRVGRNGRHYQILKFRTMCPNAEKSTGAVWSCESDPRVTALGHWLRRLHLDELPQFFNVLKGDMNLIGPRPERPEFVSELMKDVPQYHERLRVRPGITGPAQLKLGYDQSVAGVRRKVILDLDYIQRSNPILDASILLATIPYVASNLVQRKQAFPTTQEIQVVAQVNLHAESERVDRAARFDIHSRVQPNLTADLVS
tara:strand:+ start:175242 stop:176201 length:960 start_codon:yes stop_codon:yes gene_type:complete